MPKKRRILSISLLCFILIVLPDASSSSLATKLDLIHRELASVNSAWNRVFNYILQSNNRLNTNKDLGQQTNNDDEEESSSNISIKEEECCLTDHSGWWCRRSRYEGHLHVGDNLPSHQLGHRSTAGRPSELYEATDWNCQPKPMAEVIDDEVDSKNHVELPAIFSVLINFGHNDYYQFLISMVDYLENDYGCQAGFVWDPFASACRRIYCSPNQVQSFLSDYCSNTNETDADWHMTYVMELKVIELTLFVDAGYDSDNITDDALLAIIEESFTTVFAAFVGIDPDRITELNVFFLNRTSKDTNPAMDHRSMSIDFWLSQAPDGSAEPTIDAVVSLMGSLIVQDRLIAVIDGVLCQLVGLHEQPVPYETDTFANWCRGGVTTIYQNDEFVIDVNNNTETNQSELIVYIKATDQWYQSGEYLADLFFYGSSDSSVAASLSGSVAVCENRSVIDDTSCNVIQLNETEFIFLANRTVLYNGSIPFIDPVLNPGQYESLPDGGLAVCLYISQEWPMALIAESYLTLVLMSISILAMTATIVTYIIFPELRNLAGLAVMNLCLTTSGFQLCVMIGMSISVHSKSGLCVATSIVVHFQGLASVFWTNVMAVDLYLTLGRWSAAPRKPSKILPRYAIYAYGLPLVIVSIAVGINFCECTGQFEVDYGKLFCWISNPTANMLFFGLPLALAIIANVVLFIRTVAIIQGSSTCHHQPCSRLKRALCQLKLYSRMSTVMGFAWIFAFIAACFDPTSTAGMIFTFVYIVLNAMAGLFIFVAFTCNRRVYNLYRDWWAQRRNQLLRRSSTTADSLSSTASNKTKQQPSRRANTISVETFVSNSEQRETSLHM